MFSQGGAWQGWGSHLLWATQVLAQHEMLSSDPPLERELVISKPVALTPEAAFTRTGHGAGTGFSHSCAVLIPAQPCLARKEEIARATSEGLSQRANRVLERWLMRVFHFCFPWPGQNACFETRRQKHNKNLPPSLPDLSISLWQTVISFFFPSRIFFYFSFKLSPGQRGKRLFAHVLICQTGHRRALTTILGTSPRLPQLQPKGNFPTQLSPSPNTLF